MQISKQKRLPADIWTSLSYDNWTDEFCWPVNVKELSNVRLDIERALLKSLQNEKSQFVKNILRIIFNYLVIELQSLYEALIVFKRFADMGIVPDAECQSSLWSLSKGILDRGIPDYSIMNGNLTLNGNGSNTSKGQPYFPLVGYKKDYLRELHANIRSLVGLAKHLRNGKSVKNKYTLCCPITLSFATVEIEEAYYNNISLRKWFPHISKLSISDGDNLLQNCSQTITSSVCGTFKENGLDALSEKIQNYIFDLSYAYVRNTGAYLEFNQHKQKNIPEHLLAGSGHKYYTRLIGTLVRERGGKVTCVEHSDPNAMYNLTVQGYGEFGICDRYIVYTKHCADLYAKTWSQTARLQENMPELIVSPIGERSFKTIFEKFRDREIKSRTKNILYVASAFRNDFTHLEIRFPDMAYLEWHNYLFRTLKSLGYHVVCKYHPETILQGKVFEPIEGVEYVYGYYEDYLEMDCIVMFDHPMSTALMKALCTDRPIVLIDINGVCELHEEVRGYLSERCEIIEGYHDPKNRIRVDSDKLNNALLNSTKAKNHDFVTRYLIST